jgi:crotonobetainyl-CoA:carnitine CoA-transferase CaiB-like acyl-CoA transferase
MAVLPEAILQWTMNGSAPRPDGNRDPHMAPHGIFRAGGDDRWLAIAIEDDAQWRRFAVVVGRAELADDPRFATLAARKANEDALEAVVTAWTEALDPMAAAERLQQAGIPAFVSATSPDLAADEHLASRGFHVRLPHPEVGDRLHLGVPWRMSKSDTRVRTAAPCLGADTDAVLRDVCGYGADDIARLRAANVLA